jgi:lysophospholipase L1-like esterase
MPAALTAPHWWVLAGLDVAGGLAPARAAVVLGDSITDGRGSTTDLNNRWPDLLAARLLAPNGTAARNATSLVNAGIGGNAITGGGLGPTALARFSRDVLGQSGAACVVIFEGVNDIGAGVAAPAVVAGLETLRAQAAARGLRVVGATITPFGGSFYYSAAHEAARQAVNAHVRGSGGAFDAVIDFDAVLTDGGSPPKLRPEFDSGDGLHPNPAGYAAMAGSVDLAIFEGL